MCSIVLLVQIVIYNLGEMLHKFLYYCFNNATSLVFLDWLIENIHSESILIALLGEIIYFSPAVVIILHPQLAFVSI